MEEGKVKGVGLSEVTPDEVRRAHKVVPITAVELEWSLFTREVEDEMLPVLSELGIGALAYSPLGRCATLLVLRVLRRACAPPRPHINRRPTLQRHPGGALLVCGGAGREGL